jgi:hypothetical protein
MHEFIAPFVRIFESNPKWRWRVLAAGGCGLVIALLSVLSKPALFGVAGAIATVVGLTGFFLLAGCLLATMDYVQWQIQTGQKVGRVQRVLFGMGLFSVFVWAFAALVIGFPLAVWLGALMWKMQG